MSESKYLRFLVRFGSAVLITGAAVFVVLFALPWLAPFVLAIISARLTEPVILFLKKRYGILRGFSAAACTLLFIVLLTAFITLFLSSLVSRLADIAETLPRYLAPLPNLADNMQARLRTLISDVSPEMRGFFEAGVSNMLARLNALPALAAEKLLAFLSTCASCTPRVVMFVLTYAIATFFISSTYPTVIEFFVRQFPERLQEKVRRMRSDMFGTLGSWLRAELILSGVTFTVLLAAFFLLGVKGPVSAAFTVAIIDALPVLGTGIILVPWALLLFIGGQYSRGAALIVVWGFACLLRSFLEPKIIGGRVGLHPAAALFAMYLGLSVLGVVGMILFPLILIILKQFNDSGYITLWK